MSPDLLLYMLILFVLALFIKKRLPFKKNIDFQLLSLNTHV